MRSRNSLAVIRLVTVTLVLVVASCADPRVSHSVIETQPDGLRTFTVLRTLNGVVNACAAMLLPDPLSGTLRGDAAARGEKLWLERDQGVKASVVWPEGFSLRFEPDAVLYDDRGSPVGREGAVVTLDHVRPTDHGGTFDDPYIASGLLFGECYPYVEG